MGGFSMRFSQGILTISTLGALALTLPSPAGAKYPVGDTVKKVDAKSVCMIEKKRFNEPQQPVAIEGRTYYACCYLHVVELKEDPASRMDVDPISGNQVDKATATVGADKAGNVYFFENAKNLKLFHVPVEPGAEPFHTSRACHPRR
jgi:YHS domain-containing protein